MHNFHYHKGKDGKNYVTIKAGNGEPIFHSEGVENRVDLQESVHNLCDAIRRGQLKITGVGELREAENKEKTIEAATERRSE